MQESAASCSSDAAKEAKNNWTAEKPSILGSSQRSITIDLAKCMKDSSDSEDEDDVSEVDSFIMDQGDLDEESVIETSKFLLSSEGADSLDLRSADPESQAKLEALLEAAGKLSMADGKHFVDSDALRRVSCALGKAAAFPGAKTDDYTAGCVAAFSVIKAQAMKAHAASHLVQNEVSLAEACSGGHVGVVKKLLDEGRSVNETTEEGESLLSLACQAGYYELAQVLLAMRANVEDRGMKGDCTPLMEAASTGHVEIVKLLISHGADVNAQSSSGNTPLMYACAGGHEDVVKVLLEAGANVEDHNENGHTPLMEAASAGHVGVAKILLEKGAGINTHSNEFKESALTLACYKGHLEMVRFLLEAGADQEHKTDEMHTALMEASMDGHVEVARLLLNSGAQVNMPADSFESPLTLAACGGHVELAMLLLERGAKIEEVNDEGYTPLMEAAREGHEEMVALLLSQGADINAQTEETQETALTLACCGGFLEVADLLIKAGADIEMGASTPLMEAAQEGHRALVRYLLEAGTNVHAHTQTADTALTYACENGHTDVADLLLQAGADLEHESEGGRTPLMKAARAGHLCTVQFLISRGADVNRQTTNNDHTPLSLACAGGHQAVVELLLAHGSNPSHKLKDSSTMLIEASKGGHTNVVQLLLDYPHNMAPRVPPHGLHVMSPSESDQSLVVPHAYLPNLQSAPRLSEGGIGMHDSLPQNVQHVVVKQGDQKHYAGSSKTPVLHSGDFLTSAELQQVRNTPHLVPEVNYDFEGGGIGYTDSVGVLGLGGAESEDKEQRPRDRLESCINSMVKKADQYPNPEEQILQKQKILEELQRVERELQEKAHAQLMLGNRQCQDHHHSHSQMLTLSDHDAVDSLSLSPPCDGLGSTVSEAQQVAERAKLKAVTKKDGKGGKQKAFDQQQLVSKEVDSLTAVTVEALERLQLSQMMAPDDQQPLAEEALEQLNRILVDVALLPDTSNTAQDLIAEKVAPNRGVASTDAAKGSPSSALLTPAEQVTHDKNDQKTKAAAKACVPTTAATLTGGTSSSTTCKSHVNSVAVNTCSMMGNRQQTAAGKIDDVSHLTTGTLPSVAPASHTCGQTKICAQQLFLPTNNVATQYMDPSLPPHSRPFLAHPPATSPNTAFSLNLPTLQNFQSLDVDSQTDSNHDTALTLACAGGHDDLVQLLLSRGAAIEHRDKKGFTPLILAATAGHVTVVDLLLNSGAEIEAQSERTKDTPLSLACSGGRYEVVELLLTRNANKEHRNVSDYTPLSLAASSGYVNIIKLLLTHGAEINSRTGSKLGISPLMLAAMNGHTAAVKLLLDMGSDINAQIETNRNTALTLACFQGRHDVVSLLVDRRANVEHRAKTGLTPLMEAASGGHVEVGRVLLDKGADVNAPPVPSSRDTALTIAADRGHYRFVELLLSKNAQVDVKNKKGNSPLWLSANGGHMDVVQLLVSSGADIDSQDNRKVSCLMAAFRKGHIKVVKWMVKHVSQFPSDQEMTRFISTVSDKELLKKCHQCLEIIRAAKDRQAAEANKNATLLLVELDMEKTREESKKAAAARRRERKRKKKKEKLERKILDEENRKNESKNSEDRHRHHSNLISMDGKGIGRNSNQSNKFAGKGRGNATNSHLANNRSGISNHVDKYSRGQQSNDDSDDSDLDNSSSSSSSEDSPVERFSLKEKRTRHEADPKDKGKQGGEGTTRNVPPKYKELFKDKKKPENLSAEVVSSTRNKNASSTVASAASNKKKDAGEVSAAMPQVPAAAKTVKAKKGELVAPTTVAVAQSKAGNAILNAAVTCSSAAAIASPKRGAKREDEWKEVVRRCEKSKKVLVSATAISRVIGRGGCHINAIREASGAIIEIEKQKGMGDKTVIIRGSAEATRHAHQLILSLVKDPECDLAEILPKGIGNRPTTTGKSSSASGGSSSCSQQSAKSSTSQSSGSQSKASSTSSGSLSKVMSLSGGINSTSFGNTSTTMNATPAFNMPNPPFSAPLRQPNSTIRPAMTVPPMSGPFPGNHVWPAFPGPGPATSGKRSSGPPGQASSQPVSAISVTRTTTAITTSVPTSASASNLSTKNAQQQPSSGKSSAVRQLFASDNKKISAPGQSTVISAPVKASKTQATTGIGGGATFAAKVIENKNVPVSTTTVTTQSSGSSGNRQNSSGGGGGGGGGGKNTATGSAGGIRPAQSTPNISQAACATNSSSAAPKRGVSVPNGPIPVNANAQPANAPSPTAFLTQYKMPPATGAPASAQNASVMVRQMSMPLVQTNMQHQQQSQHQQQMLFSQNQQLMLQQQQQQQQQQQNVTQEYSPFNNLFSVHSWVKESESSNKGMNFASVAAANVKASSSSTASSVSSAMAALESVPVPAADASKAVGYRGNVSSSTCSSHGTASTSAPTSSSPRDFQGRLPSSAPCTPPLGPIAPLSSTLMRKESPPLLQSPNTGLRNMVERDQVTAGSNCSSGSPAAAYGVPNMAPMSSPPNPPVMHGGPPPCPMQQVPLARVIEMQQQHQQNLSHQHQQQHVHHHHHQQQQQHMHMTVNSFANPSHHSSAAHRFPSVSAAAGQHFNNGLVSSTSVNSMVAGSSNVNLSTGNGAAGGSSGQGPGPGQSQQAMTSVLSNLNPNAPDFSSRSAPPHSSSSAPSSAMAMHSHPQQHAMPFGRYPGMKEALHGPMSTGTASSANGSSSFRPLFGMNHNPQGTPNSGMPFMTTHPSQASARMPFPPNSAPNNPNQQQQQQQQLPQHLGPHGQADFSQHPSSLASLRHGSGNAAMMSSSLEALSLMGTLNTFGQGHMAHSHPMLGHGNHAGPGHMQPLVGGVNLPAFAGLSGSVHQSHRSSNNTQHGGSSAKEETGSPITNISPVQSPHPSNPTSPMTMLGLQGEQAMKMMSEDRKLPRPIGMERAHHRKGPAFNSSSDTGSIWAFASSGNMRSDWASVNQSAMASEGPQMQPDDGMSSMHSGYLGRFADSLGPLENSLHHMDQSFQPHMMTNNQHPTNINSPYPPFVNGVPPQILNHIYNSAAAAAAMSNNGLSLNEIWNKIGHVDGGPGNMVGPMHPQQTQQQQQQSSGSMSTVNSNSIGGQPSGIVIAGPGVVPGQTTALQHLPADSMMWNNWM